MEKEVLLSISGTHMSDAYQSGADNIEVITPGNYFFKNGKHYVLYDEPEEGSGRVTRNTLTFTDDYLSLTKHGTENSRMIVESLKRNVSDYYTPAGSLHVEMAGEDVAVSEEEGRIHVDCAYGLSINYQQVARCSLKIDICAKEEMSLI